MSKKKNLVPLFGVAFVVAIASTGIFYGLFVGKLNSASTPAPSNLKVVMAARDLPAGTMLKPTDLSVMAWPAPPLPAGAVTNPSEAVGTKLVTATAANELITRSRLASKDGGATDSGSLGIPEGMRAVSLQVFDSAGVVALLQPGHRVDVQVVSPQTGSIVPEPQLRTVLENIEVLSVPRESAMQGRGGSQVVTVLASPKDAAVLGLADSMARVRLALRNPMDEGTDSTAAVGLRSLFRAPAPKRTVVARAAAPRPTLPAAVEYVVRLVGVTGSGAAEVESMLARAGDARSPLLQVLPLRENTDLRNMLKNAGIEVLTSSRIQAGKRRSAAFVAHAQWTGDQPTVAAGPSCGLKIHFHSLDSPAGRLRIQVEPEVTMPADAGMTNRKIATEIDVADGQSFVLRGFASPEQTAVLWERLFPAQGTRLSGRQMLVVVTPNRKPGGTRASSD